MPVLQAVLFDNNIGTLIECPAHKIGSYAIPNSVTNIGDSAFYGCSSLTGITIPNGVANIGNSAFYGCSSLTSMAIPNGVTNIGDYAFQECYILTNVTIPDGVTSIGSYAFDGCGLAAVEIPNTVTSIGSQAFGNCSSLTNVTIPDSVTNIPASAFINCATLAGVTIPASVTSIGDYAFGYCPGLASIIIPNSVTNLGHYTFGNCAKLKSVYFEGNAPSAYGTVFHSDSGTVYYLPGTTGWGATFGGLPTVEWQHPPTLQLTSPVSGQSLSTALLTVGGKASDALGVATVRYQLNANGWMAATPANNWTNWSGSLTLTTRSNTVRAYAVDILGSTSATQSVSFLYVQSGTLTVRTNGQGRISPAYNGKLLEIGENYTMTATPAAGFVFANWTDGLGAVVTNKPALTFTMSSNLSFTANFADITKPTLAITNLVNNQQWGYPSLSIKGWAKDNAQVTNVQYRLGSGDWLTADGTTRWSGNITGLVAGKTNTLSAYAQDSSGLCSLTSVVQVVYNQFLPVNGTYNGLFSVSDLPADRVHESSGFLKLTVSGKGAYSGSLVLAGKTNSLGSGQFDVNGQASLNVVSGTNTIAVDLYLSSEPGSDYLMGTLSSQGWVADLLADRAVFTATNEAPYAGNYTLLFSRHNQSARPNHAGGHGVWCGDGGCSGQGGVGWLAGRRFAVAGHHGIQGRLVADLCGLYGGKRSVWGWFCFTTNHALRI